MLDLLDISLYPVFSFLIVQFNILFMLGIVFDIRHFSINDGPGIRTTVFLKGYPLHCPWCHNPEGRSAFAEKMQHTYHRGKNSYAKNETVGRAMKVSEILAELENSRTFFDESKGGVTFSGGEPTLQSEFLYQCLYVCQKAGIHTAIDTCGFCDATRFSNILSVTDLLLFDLKHIDEDIHKKYTGVSLKPILDNLATAATDKPVVIRIPLIPGFNDTITVHKEMISTLQKMPFIRQIDLLPYHAFAASKYARLNQPYSLQGISEINPDRLKKIFDLYSNQHYTVSIGG